MHGLVFYIFISRLPEWRSGRCVGSSITIYTTQFPSTFVGSHQWGGWIQVGLEMDPVVATLANLRNQMVLGLPMALLVADVGGYFLAGRALRPIERITDTAQSINHGAPSVPPYILQEEPFR